MKNALRNPIYACPGLLIPKLAPSFSATAYVRPARKHRKAVLMPGH